MSAMVLGDSTGLGITENCGGDFSREGLIWLSSRLKALLQKKFMALR